jgi:ferric iron reductase protein FhuF
VINLLARAHSDDWIPATDLISGVRLEELFALPERLWTAPAHAAAVLAWKIYAYRLIQPLAKTWNWNRTRASSGQVPVLSADNVRFRVQPAAPYVMLELRSQDPVTLPDEQRGLDFLRDTLIDGHLRPLMQCTKERRRISERVLWGQAATAIAYCFADHSPTPATAAQDCARLTELLPITGLAGIGEDSTVWQTTCCLAFASPGLTACSTCVTATRPRHRRRTSTAAPKRAAPLDA